MFEIGNTLSFNKDKLVDGNRYDYVTRTSFNQGILQTTGFVNEENINPSGTWSLGLLQMDFFYRKKPWYAGQFVRIISSKIDIPSGAIPFITTILNSQKRVFLSVLVRNVDKTFNNLKVNLPIKNGEIDFEFMESFVAELEAQRVAELEAYLLATGLKDYELTDKEKEALEDYENGRINLIELKVSDIFNVSSSKKRFDANKVEILTKGYPYVVRTSNNNGIKGYLNENINYLNEGNTISFGQDTATMFYQENPYFTGDKIKILKSKFKIFNKYSAQYFIGTMSKSFSSFSWGSSSFSEKVINEQKIFVKIKDNEIDFEYIETLILAIQKLVIRDIVLFSDRKIDATKQVIDS